MKSIHALSMKTWTEKQFDGKKHLYPGKASKSEDKKKEKKKEKLTKIFQMEKHSLPTLVATKNNGYSLEKMGKRGEKRKRMCATAKKMQSWFWFVLELILIFCIVFKRTRRFFSSHLRKNTFKGCTPIALPNKKEDEYCTPKKCKVGLGLVWFGLVWFGFVTDFNILLCF